MKARAGSPLLMTGLALLFSVALLAMSVASVAAVDEADMEVRDRNKEFLFILDQGETSRLEIEMNEGGGLNWLLTSGERAIDLHMYSEDESGETIDHIGPFSRIKERSGTFVAPANDTYIITTHREQKLEARVRLTLDGEYGIQVMEGMEQATEVPAPAIAAVLGGTLLALGVVRRIHRQ